jgi:hypothetical protein
MASEPTSRLSAMFTYIRECKTVETH